MYNFDQEPERRHLVDESGLNTFLSKLYGLIDVYKRQVQYFPSMILLLKAMF